MCIENKMKTSDWSIDLKFIPSAFLSYHNIIYLNMCGVCMNVNFIYRFAALKNLFYRDNIFEIVWKMYFLHNIKRRYIFQNMCCMVFPSEILACLHSFSYIQTWQNFHYNFKYYAMQNILRGKKQNKMNFST